MTPRPKTPQPEKPGLHPRNPHRARYDFPQLTQSCPALAPFVARNRYGTESIDFANPAAVKALNQALLKQFYGIAHWDIPPGYLCPPIPGRADYIHHVADLLAGDPGGAIPRGPSVAMLDIGIGANCVYPIIGCHDYGWRFVGTDIDPVALSNVRRIVANNPALAGLVECRRQTSSRAIFRGVVAPGETFALAICNPPFHASREEAAAGTQRKLRNLSGAKDPATVLNFGGQTIELTCEGGELGFVRRMIAESASFPDTCRWFTTLVAQGAHLLAIRHALKAAQVADVRIIPMAQGQKQSRIVAWTFREKPQMG
jgi:23S rRNA (adenine1618-N6)-methyltransferase